MHTSSPLHSSCSLRQIGRSYAGQKKLNSIGNKTQRGAVIAEAAIVTPILITFAMLAAYICEVTINYMSLAATAHETVDIAAQYKAPSNIAGSITQKLPLEESQYTTCLRAVEEDQTPTEICLNIIAQWRSQKLLNSFAMTTKLTGLTVASQVNASDDISAPRLAVTIGGTSDRIFERIFSWVLSTSASTSLATPTEGV